MRLVIGTFVCLIATCAINHCEAAAVAWGTPFELVSDADIDLSFGPIVYAQNGGDNIGNESKIPTSEIPALADPKVVSIGSQAISFEGIDAVYGSDSFFGSLGFVFETFGDAVDHLSGQSNNVTFGIRNHRTVPIPQVTFDPTPATEFDPPEEADYSIATGNTGLDSILDSIVFMDSRRSLGSGETESTAGALEIYLNNLEVGKQYQVQIIGGADTRQFDSDPAVIDPSYQANSTGNGVSPIGTLSDGLGNMVTNVGAFLDLDGDEVGHVTTVLGTFTADSTTQQLDFLLQRGRNAGISAVILLEAAEVFPGDFNGDGFVDAADYTVWRDNLGSSHPLAGNGDESGNSTGVVDAADYTLWRTRFGSVLNGSSLASVASQVPEPQSLVLVLLGAVLAVMRRRRGRAARSWVTQ